MTTPAAGLPAGVTSVLTPRGVGGPRNIFRTDVRNAPLDVDSAVLAADIKRQYDLAHTVNLWGAFQTPWYEVDSGVPGVPVSFWDFQLKGFVPSQLYTAGRGQHFLNVPIPGGLVPASGSDGAVFIHDPLRNAGWTFWKLTRDRVITAGDVSRGRNRWAPPEGGLRTAVEGETIPGWSAVWGGRMDQVQDGYGIYRDGTGTSATGIESALGQLTIADMAAGVADHAMTLVLPQLRLGSWFCWPAQRSDGKTDSPTVPMEGMRVRFAAGADFSLCHPSWQVWCRAVQRYGALIVDRAGSVSAMYESGNAAALATGVNPWVALIGSTPSYRLMDRTPWEALEVIERGWGAPNPDGGMVARTGLVAGR